ncbi:MAG: winged helix-turn-helix transcriptional regulator [Xanthobacteraceae bacterium]|jgi:DNA-binding HxlR family transcriptional regulator
MKRNPDQPTRGAAKATAPVRGSKTGRPIMALLDLLGRRWTLRIVWEMRDAALTSRALRAACDDASPTIIHARLTELREAGLVETTGSGYGLTAMGQEMLRVAMPLYAFAERWSKRNRPPA